MQVKLTRIPPDQPISFSPIVRLNSDSSATFPWRAGTWYSGDTIPAEEIPVPISLHKGRLIIGNRSLSTVLRAVVAVDNLSTTPGQFFLLVWKNENTRRIYDITVFDGRLTEESHSAGEQPAAEEVYSICTVC